MDLKVFKKILEIVTDYDLSGVIEVSNSSNEYFPEAMAIYDFIENNKKVHEITTDMLADNIQLIFIHSFSVLPHISLCRGMALEILAIV